MELNQKCMRFRWTKDNVQIARQLFKNGARPKDISNAVGCSLRCAQYFASTIAPEFSGYDLKFLPNKKIEQKRSIQLSQSDLVKLKELIDQSQEAAKHSYSPYSNHPIGAALLLQDGTIIKACNVENVSFGLSICAERLVIAKAISDGHRNIKAIAVHDTLKDLAFPCGACRQFISEFGEDIDVYLVNKNSSFYHCKSGELLPTRIEFS